MNLITKYGLTCFASHVAYILLASKRAVRSLFKSIQVPKAFNKQRFSCTSVAKLWFFFDLATKKIYMTNNIKHTDPITIQKRKEESCLLD